MHFAPSSYEPPRIDPSLPPLAVNLYSDTQTLPDAAMKEAMAAAPLGDEQLGQDPTVWALCDRVAALLGKEAAVFLPSGTMCNQAALATHCRPGDEVLAHQTAHILSSEASGAAAIAGVQITGLTGPRGQFDAETLRAALRPRNRNAPPQILLEVEQTANAGGGAVWALEKLQAVTALAHEAGLATHMDGARLMNACVASGIAPHDMTAGCDSVWIDFSKGLGAPIGGVLAGSRDFIGQAWRWKQRLGGALRQGGIVAAACLYALDHNIDRLAEDHANARALASGLAQIPGITVETPDTNLVFFNTQGTGLPAAELAARARQHGIAFSVNTQWRARACTHLDVSRAGIDQALAVIRACVAAG